MPTERATLPLDVRNTSQITGVQRLHGAILSPGTANSTATLMWTTRLSGNRAIKLSALANSTSAIYNPTLPVSIDDAGSASTGITITMTGSGARLQLFVNDYTDIYGPGTNLVSRLIVLKETEKALLNKFTCLRESSKALLDKVTVRRETYKQLLNKLIVRVSIGVGKALLNKLIVRKMTEKALLNKLIVHRSAEKALVARIIVEYIAATKNLLCKMTVGQAYGSKTLLNLLTVHRSSTKALPCEIDVQQIA